MPSHTISVKVSEELKDRIEGFQQDGETRSSAVRRLIRRGLREGPGDGAYIAVVTFSIAWIWAGAVNMDFTALYVESAIFHLLAIIWVTFPEVRDRFYNLRG